MSDKKGKNQEEKMLHIRLPKELHRQITMLSYDLDMTITDLCREGIEYVMQKYHKKLPKDKS